MSAIVNCVSAIWHICWFLTLICLQLLFCEHVVAATADREHVGSASVAVVLCAGADR